MVAASEQYAAIGNLRDGREFQIRAFKAHDRTGLLAALGRSSALSVYRRFFSARRDMSERELEFFTKINFDDHVALVALVDEDDEPTIVGGARYIKVEAIRAEMALAVMDLYQGQGIGTALVRHLAEIARAAGIKELIAEVLSDNAAMLKVFSNSGMQASTSRRHGHVHVVLRVASDFDSP
jgi:GNAT superfamily N-acetyltransferase